MSRTPAVQDAASYLAGLEKKEATTRKWVPSESLLRAIVSAYQNNYSLEFIAKTIHERDKVKVGPRAIRRVLEEQGVYTLRGGG